MRSQNRIRRFLLLIVVLGSLAALWFPFQAYVWEPYQARRTMLNLPTVPEVTLEDLGMPTSDLSFRCLDLATSLSPSELEEKINALATAVENSPTDLCSGNQFREGVRYLVLRNGQFALKLESFPTDLAAIAKNPDSVPTEETNSSKISPDEQQPAKLFHSLTATPTGNVPESELQLGLAYVDLMMRQGGREHKGQLSTRSIEALGYALDRKPYMIAALYARGLNYLYWPVIAGKLPLAVRDLKTCIALSNLAALKEHPPLVIAEAYRALGDSYVKLADSTPDEGTQRALLTAGRDWWTEGRTRFPDFRGFDDRLKTPLNDLPRFVDSARGLETYINTDLDLLWKK
jgi:hypothetical protein